MFPAALQRLVVRASCHTDFPLLELFIICAALITATCLVNCWYKGLIRIQSPASFHPAQTIPPLATSRNHMLGDILARIRRRKQLNDPLLDDIPPIEPPRSPRHMRYSRQTRALRKSLNSVTPFTPPQPPIEKSKQPYDAFLVLDVEATCQEGTDFNFPNEIIVRE